MPKFAYVSRNPQGQKVTAVAESPNRQALLTELRDKGLVVIEVKEIGGAEAKSKERKDRHTRQRARRVSGIDTGEMSVFWRQFATMIAAGLPLVEALESIANELEHKQLRRVLLDVTASMWEGFNLSQSIGKHPKIFSPMVIALIGAAEESGSLPEIANQLATFLENRDRLIRKVQAALTYPVFLSGFFLIVCAVATFWIIPKFRDIYSGFDAKLPWITEVVFAVNAFVLKYILWLVAALAAVVLVFALWAQKPSGRRTLDRWALKTPLFGPLIQKASVARFCRSLAILLSGGVPINRALEMAEQTAGNAVVAKAINDARQDILKGNKIAPALRKQQVFPKMCVRMVSAGEETGNLSGLLEKTAEFYEARVDAALTTINSLIEPVMIIVIGGFVLIFVLSLYMPIFKLAATAHG